MKYLLVSMLLICVGGCSSPSESLDPSIEAIAGTWKAVGGDDEGVTLVLKASGKYEWIVAGGGEQDIIFEDSPMMKNNPDGGRTIFGTWELSGKTLVIDMLAEKEKYNIAKLTADEMRLTGYESINFERER